jgi:hypothetical protein
VGRKYSYIDQYGKYHRVDEEVASSPSKNPAKDYYKGVKPSDLSRLDNRQLYVAADRLHESIISGVGTAEERAGANEAYHEVVVERRRRRQTLR